MNNFNAVLTDCNGFKKGVVISIDYKHYNYQYDMLDRIRDYINLYYTNWKFLDFELDYTQYTMLNNNSKTVIYTFRYYHSSCFTTIFTYINNGRDLISHTVI